MELVATYEKLWREFGDDVCSLYEAVGAFAANAEPDSLQTLMTSLYGIPYREVRRAMRWPVCDGEGENPGAVTGLFFEQLVVAVAVSYIRGHVRDVKVQRNGCAVSAIQAISRDPDLYVSSGNRHVVFEIKASPKKRDLEWVLEQHDRYTAAGFGYYLIGGYVSASAELLQRIEGGWACFLEGSPRNSAALKTLPTVAAVLEDACRWLRRSNDDAAAQRAVAVDEAVRR